MLALHSLYSMLRTFRSLFARHTPWVLFCVVILGFIGTPHIEGRSSLCRFWLMDGADYHRLLHFFHSSAWCLEGSDHPLEPSGLGSTGRGDRAGTCGPPGRSYGGGQGCPTHAWGRHPAIKRAKHRVNPATFGAITGGASASSSVRSPKRFVCLWRPGSLRASHTSTPRSQAPRTHDTQCVALVQMALDFVRRPHTPSLLVLDAFFAIGVVFALANSWWSLALQQPALFILTRAKKNYVAYHEPLAPTVRSPGRPRTYGDTVKLAEVFTTLPGAVALGAVPRLWPRRNDRLSRAQSRVETNQRPPPLSLCHHLTRTHRPHG